MNSLKFNNLWEIFFQQIVEHAVIIYHGNSRNRIYTNLNATNGVIWKYYLGIRFIESWAYKRGGGTQPIQAKQMGGTGLKSTAELVYVYNVFYLNKLDFLQDLSWRDDPSRR